MVPAFENGGIVPFTDGDSEGRLSSTAMTRCPWCCHSRYQSSESAFTLLGSRGLNFSKHIRNHSSSVAQKVIRKRLSSYSSRSSATLIHRIAEASDVSRTTGENPNAYINLLFLSNSVVLAANDVGGIEVFRLRESTRSGERITSCLPLPTEPRQHQQQQRGVYKSLKQLKNGEAFLTCTKTGDIELFDTEHTGGAYCILRRAVQGPKRQFFRHDNFFLHDMKTIINDFYKIPDWDITAVRPMNQSFYRFNALMNGTNFLTEVESVKQTSLDSIFKTFYSWQYQSTMMVDCFENHLSGTTLIAVVDPDMDCFYVQYLSDGTTASRFMCVPVLKSNEYITSICFLSETTILTSHVTTSKTHSSRKNFENILREWDLRKITTSKNGSSFQSTECYYHLPSFPLEENIRQMSSVQEYEYENKSSIHQGHWVSTCTAGDSMVPADNWIVTGLRGPTYASTHQHVIVTSCDLNCLTMVTNKTAGRTTLLDAKKDIVSSWEHHSFCQETAKAVPQFIAPSITPDMQIMACYDSPSRVDNDNRDIHTFLLFDLARKAKSHSSLDDEDGNFSNYSSKKKQRTVGHKHNLTEFSSALYDRYGLATSTTSAALNPTGNNLVCATTDGDIYLFGVP